MSLNISQVNGALTIPGQVIPTGNSSNVIANTSFVAGAVRDLSLNVSSVLSTLVPVRASNIVGGLSGELLYQSGPNNTAKLAAGTSGNVLRSNGVGAAPTWTNTLSDVTVGFANELTGGTAGDLVYQTGNNMTSLLTIGSTNKVLTSSGSAPQWSDTLSLGSGSSSIGGVTLNGGAVSNVSTISAGNGSSSIGGVTLNAGAVSGVTTLGLSGAISGVTTLALSGAISGATSTDTINGVVINSGAVSGVTTISAGNGSSSIGGVTLNGGALTNVTTISAGNGSSSIGGVTLNAGTVSGDLNGKVTTVQSVTVNTTTAESPTFTLPNSASGIGSWSPTVNSTINITGGIDGGVYNVYIPNGGNFTITKGSNTFWKDVSGTALTGVIRSGGTLQSNKKYLMNITRINSTNYLVNAYLYE